jgi:hypothetical protein
MKVAPRLRVSWIILAAVLAACASDQIVNAPDSKLDPKYVTGEALAALQRNGEIRIPDLHATDGTEIDETRAFELSRAYMHDYVPLALELYEEDRGASIDLAALTPCPRAFYVAGNYDLASDVVSNVGRKVLSGHWLVSYCNRERVPIISISLSALAVDVSIIEGPIEMPNPGGNFITFGVTVGVTAVPPSPESAIEAVAILTGRKVSKVPQLVPAHFPFSPQVAKWHITLDDSVDIRGVTSGTHERTADLYYGFGDDWNSVRLQRGIPASASTEIFNDPVNGSVVPITVHRKPGVPASFEDAVVEAP